MIIGVTGKSGSGKSTFAKALAKRLNYQYVDIDVIGHKALLQPEIINTIKSKYPDIEDEYGYVDRKRLGDIVFSNRDEMRALSDCVYNYMKKEILAALYSNKVVLDWILLPHTDFWQLCEYKILVSSDEETRIKKVMDRDQISREYLDKRDSASPDFTTIDVRTTIHNDYTEKSIKSAVSIVFDTIYDKNIEDCISLIDPETIKKYHTKQLLECLHEQHVYTEYCECCRSHSCMVKHHMNADIIKAELAKRPHIPNKKESKENRKQAKKAGAGHNKNR